MEQTQQILRLVRRGSQRQGDCYMLLSGCSCWLFPRLNSPHRVRSIIHVFWTITFVCPVLLSLFSWSGSGRGQASSCVVEREWLHFRRCVHFCVEAVYYWEFVVVEVQLLMHSGYIFLFAFFSRWHETYTFSPRKRSSLPVLKQNFLSWCSHVTFSRIFLSLLCLVFAILSLGRSKRCSIFRTVWTCTGSQSLVTGGWMSVCTVVLQASTRQKLRKRYCLCYVIVPTRPALIRRLPFWYVFVLCVYIGVMIPSTHN